MLVKIFSHSDFLIKTNPWDNRQWEIWSINHHECGSFFMTNAMPTDFFHCKCNEVSYVSAVAFFSISNHTQTRVFCVIFSHDMSNDVCLTSSRSQSQATMSAQHVKPNTAPPGDWCSMSSTHMAWKFMLNHQTPTNNSKIKRNHQRHRRHQVIISVEAQRVQQVPQMVPANHCNNSNSKTFHRPACVTIHYCRHLIYMLIHSDCCGCLCRRHCLRVN